MASNYGTLFRISTWGESHGGGVGVVIDGCPPQVPVTAEEIQFELDRRRPGQSDIVTPRKEADRCEILSGLWEGKTTGTPISIMVRNTDARPEAYSEMATMFRPSHADFTYQTKYGIRNHEGGGRSSARETIGRVAAGALAKKVLGLLAPGLQILAYVESVRDLRADIDFSTLSFEAIEANPVRCPDPVAAQKMIALIREMRSEGNSVGGVIGCQITGVPAGWGEPVFDRLEADLAKGVLSLPASKGFEIGSGFAGTLLSGLQHNDPFEIRDGQVRTTSNRSGGIQGGISNGEAIQFRVAFKPTATVLRPQQTVNLEGEATELQARGRHDPCVLPRAVPMVEAMAALTLVDHALRHAAQNRVL